MIIWLISILTIAGVIVRPFKLPEAVWAVAGAALLLVFGLITWHEGWAGVLKGTDVYLFLTGMMLLAETAREEKLFDYLAAHATKRAKGSPGRLFVLIYLVGTVVTVLLSNDAAAVVLTPAVAAAVRAARVEKPLPYLFICAFIANAASFVLPISNPANLVIYGSHLPPLLHWLSQYALPSVISIAATFILLYLLQRKALPQAIETDIELPQLSFGGKIAFVGIGVTAGVLLAASALDVQLGLPTAITGLLTALVVLVNTRSSPVKLIKGTSWAVLPLVAGLFVMVEALNKTGITHTFTAVLKQQIEYSVAQAAWTSGVIIAFACNLMNNLPAGLITGQVINAGHVPETIKSAALIGVDLGPNLSVTGSLATILWLVALRRENQTCTAREFLKLGLVVMTGALLITLASLWL